MSAVLAEPILGRQPPPVPGGAWLWARRNLFSSLPNTLVSVALLALLGWLASRIASWALLHAVFAPDNAMCRAAHDQGACWGVIVEKGRLILFGRYPYAEQWRAMTASAAMTALLVASCFRALWGRSLALVWLVTLSGCVALMHGGLLGLERVETARWGGLPLTLGLSVISLACAFPLSVAIALGRTSTLPAIRTVCTVYVEFLRGLPLISVLFMASVIFPLFLPRGMSVDVLIRVLVALTVFNAASLAEVIRAGLQALPKGQVEAAKALGMTWVQRVRHIQLPQALRMMVPAIVNTFIVAFKDTALVTVVSLYELTGSLQLALGDADWRMFFLEGEIFVAAIYFAFCFALSRYSQWVERH